MEKLNILSQYIYKFNSSDENVISDVLTSLKNEEWVKNNVNQYSRDTLLHKNARYSKMYNWFYECIQHVKNDLEFECDELKITQCWANNTSYGEWHHPHTHSNSVISGIFYVNESNSNTWFSIPSIWDITKNDNGSYGAIKLLYGQNYENKSRIIHKQPTSPGDLIIFPSSLYHSVDEHLMTDQNRYSISFNTFPSGKIGKTSHLSSLEIEVK